MLIALQVTSTTNECWLAEALRRTQRIAQDCQADNRLCQIENRFLRGKTINSLSNCRIAPDADAWKERSCCCGSLRPPLDETVRPKGCLPENLLM